jgi:hypothetical protein
VRCTHCGRHYFEAEAETLEEARQEALEAGWLRCLVQNTSYWDFCPQCVRNGQARIAEACAGCFTPLNRDTSTVETINGAMHVSCAVARGYAP